jgi:hypothetical protein
LLIARVSLREIHVYLLIRRYPKKRQEKTTDKRPDKATAANVPSALQPSPRLSFPLSTDSSVFGKRSGSPLGPFEGADGEEPLEDGYADFASVDLVCVSSPFLFSLSLSRFSPPVPRTG